MNRVLLANRFTLGENFHPTMPADHDEIEEMKIGELEQIVVADTNTREEEEEMPSPTAVRSSSSKFISNGSGDERNQNCSSSLLLPLQDLSDLLSVLLTNRARHHQNNEGITIFSGSGISNNNNNENSLKPPIIKHLFTRAEGSESVLRAASPRKAPLQIQFSAMRSTEDNHASCDLKFYGEFAGLRERVDYSHHKNYTMKRQIFQDTIVNEFLNSVGTTSTKPWMVFTAGAMGVGKSYTMGKLLEKGHFPLHTFIHVDPDKIRQRLPEFCSYLEENPELAGQLTQKEAGFIAEIISMAGLQAGKNVLVDGTLRDAEWYRIQLKRLRQDFPAIRLSLLYVTAPREEVLKRAAQRALATGRVVPRDLLETVLEQVPQSVQILAPLVDYYAELNNKTIPPPPSVVGITSTNDIELVTAGETWENFRAQWVQACA